jgi:transcriptional regulator with PAS, ATPase and Fis domain
VPEGLLESELFGYEPGAFTGAIRKKRGKFELASGGVLFLDEIGDMPPALQSKLLHVCQSGEFAPLGSESEIKTNTWIIAATNKTLEEEVRNGKFREDLYYRLNTINIYIPPLCNRPEDIPPLIDYYLAKYASRFNGHGIEKPNGAVMMELMAYAWPGNVRELQNMLNRYLVSGSWEKTLAEISNINGSESNVMMPAKGFAEFPMVSDLLNFDGDISVHDDLFSLKTIMSKARDRIEKKIISDVLGHIGWNRTKAAKILNVSYRTILNKIKTLNIELPPISSEDVTSYVLDHTEKNPNAALKLLETSYKAMLAKMNQASSTPQRHRPFTYMSYGNEPLPESSPKKAGCRPKRVN